MEGLTVADVAGLVVVVDFGVAAGVVVFAVGAGCWLRSVAGFVAVCHWKSTRSRSAKPIEQTQYGRLIQINGRTWTRTAPFQEMDDVLRQNH